jgi:adenylate kinase family enzyme
VTIPKRVVIIGNSGSGKSHLAAQIAAKDNRLVIALDELFWLPGGHNQKRPAGEVRTQIARLRNEECWVVEGVFGDLARAFLERAELLIWLDMDWETCRSSLTSRGSESSKQLDPDAAEVAFEKLPIWASEYWNRTTPSSHSGHHDLVGGFTGKSMVFTQRSQLTELVQG